MIVKRIEELFKNNSGEVAVDIDNYNACQEIAVLVSAGSLTATGKITDNQEIEMPISFISCNDGQIVDTCNEGLYILFGGEALSSVTFVASTPTQATAKFIY